MKNLVTKQCEQPAKVADRVSIWMRASGLDGTVGGNFRIHLIFNEPAIAFQSRVFAF